MLLLTLLEIDTETLLDPVVMEVSAKDAAGASTPRPKAVAAEAVASRTENLGMISPPLVWQCDDVNRLTLLVDVVNSQLGDGELCLLCCCRGFSAGEATAECVILISGLVVLINEVIYNWD